MYNLSNLSSQFKVFLSSENISAVSSRNYLSDIRHFIGWKNTFNPAQNTELYGLYDLLQYRSYLIKEALPLKTINRRLSALRKFTQFCTQNNLITPFELNIPNVTLNELLKGKKDAVLKEFNEYMQTIHSSESDEKRYIDDVNEFLMHLLSN